ncbi:hypothetical protein PENTCL1PPCAC_10226, partial [Pristionchus entomophagus]
LPTPIAFKCCILIQFMLGSFVILEAICVSIALATDITFEFRSRCTMQITNMISEIFDLLEALATNIASERPQVLRRS